MVSVKLKPAVFLDRDGTIIEEVGYIDSPDKIQPIAGADKAIKLFTDARFKIIVVSNQSGVAHGYFDEDTVLLVNNRVAESFASYGANIDAFYYCPHHPDYGDQNYRKDCDCRKPKPGMFLKAAEEHKIDLSKSIMIGDKFTDIQAGRNLNLLSILVLTGFGREQNQKIKSNGLHPPPDFVAENISEAAMFIKKKLDL
jgi:D-glycero-D-manno-heptose 1,7-bisphosphate phosphatase